MISVPERVKDALRDGRLLKNYRFNVLESDGTVDFTIDNDTLVYESVKFDERMCSGDTLKFGLCEGSSLEFQYFDHDNINGRQIQSFIDVQYMVNSTQLTKTDNLFTIELPGTYQIIVPAGSPSFEVEVQKGSGPAPAEEVDSMNMEQTLTYDDMDKGNSLKIISSSALTVTLNRADGQKFPLWYTIPMGYFTVKKCSRQASTGIQKVTAYNKLQSEYLDASANAILLDNFGGDDTITLTLYDIQKHLLDDYEITERPKEHIPISESPFTPALLVIGNYRFSQQTNVANPISYGNFQYITGSTPPTYFPIVIKGIGATVTTSSTDYWDIEFLKGDIGVFSDNLMDFLVDTINDAKLTGVTRDSLINTFKTLSPFYIEIDGTQFMLFDDAKSKLDEINNLIHHGASTIKIAIPTEVDFSYDQSIPPTTTYTAFSCRTTTNFKYYQYTTSNLVDGTLTPDVRFSDGSLYDGNIFASDMFSINSYTLSDAEKITMTISDIPDFTLRDIVSANYETQCQYGQIDRVTDLFYGADLSHTALYPADTLYPANSLYPGGVSETSFMSWYSKLWTDTVGEQSFRNLIITYKGLDANNTPADFTYETVVDQNGTTDYIMDDNWLFRNLIWTQADIATYAAAMVTKMQSIKWFPFEMWAAGLPYIETGDMIEIIVGDETHTSYVLQRQLSGIQNLQDTYINGTLDIF